MCATTQQEYDQGWCIQYILAIHETSVQLAFQVHDGALVVSTELCGHVQITKLTSH